MIAKLAVALQLWWDSLWIPDPVWGCEVYRTDGCAHVDGFLCNMNTCNIRGEHKCDQ